MTRWMIVICGLGLIGALSIGHSEAAKSHKKKTEKVEYLRAAGSEPQPPAVKPMRKKAKAAE